MHGRKTASVLVVPGPVANMEQCAVRVHADVGCHAVPAIDEAPRDNAFEDPNVGWAVKCNIPVGSRWTDRRACRKARSEPFAQQSLCSPCLSNVETRPVCVDAWRRGLNLIESLIPFRCRNPLGDSGWRPRSMTRNE